MECVFCDIVRGSRAAHVIYEDEFHMAFLDRYPVVDGHTLLIPKAHRYVITEMSAQSAGRLFSLVPGLSSAVLKATGARAFNVGQNNGHDAKQVVPHVHVHIIPRRSGDRIDWTRRRICDDAIFSTMAERIREALATSPP